jgi:hypothetical protein
MTFAANLAQSASNNQTMRNRIINGAMTVAQRGTSFTNPNTWTLDRMYYGTGTATTVISQSSNAPSGFTYSLYGTQGATTWTPSGYQWQAVIQTIEGNNFYDMAFGTASANPVTISFWVYASQTGTYNFALCNASQADIFDATVTRSYVTTYTVNAANTWQYVTITVPGDTSGTWIGATNGSAVAVVFNLGSGSSWTTATTNAWQTGKYIQSSGTVSQATVANSTFYITGVQLEEGTAASPFENRLYGTEFALCQRYYQINNGYTGAGTTSTIFSGNINFTVTMRSSPTLGQTAVLQITDTYTADYTQSVTNIYITSGVRVTSNSVSFGSNNYTGLTAGRPYLAISGQTGSVTLSAEL